MFFFFKQKTAYGIRISYWSSDVCSSDLTTQRMAGSVSQRIAACRSARARGRSMAFPAWGRLKVSVAVALSIERRIGASLISRLSWGIVGASPLLDFAEHGGATDRKSTRLNSSP